MDGESYEDPDIAKLLNEEFVCIKVDRDERPDVDAGYQRAVQALTGQGGWPLTAFLNPSGEVFFGGTYFPPEPNPFGRPGFASVLRQVARLYRDQRDKVAQNAEARSEEHTSELQSPCNLVCRLLLEKKKKENRTAIARIPGPDNAQERTCVSLRHRYPVRI